MTRRGLLAGILGLGTLGPSFAADEVPDVIESVIGTYRAARTASETFIDTLRRIGIEPFKAPANAVRTLTRAH